MIAITPARLRVFLRSIEKPEGEYGCWVWRGAVNGDGYASSGGPMPAHRMAYTWMVGPIPGDMELDHLCRNRRCVNPHHLEPVTKTENIRRIREFGPREFRPYCRNGHPLVRGNARVWSDGKGRKAQVRCYACHDGEQETTIRFIQRRA